jgi:hypothetical protein
MPIGMGMRLSGWQWWRADDSHLIRSHPHDAGLTAGVVRLVAVRHASDLQTDSVGP